MAQVQMVSGSAGPNGHDVDIERTARLLGGWCGMAGALALAAYFAAPAFLGWPYAGASGAAITNYANTHAALFYGGAWLQVTGTLLSVVFFLSLVHLARASASVAGLTTVVAAAALLATVVAEAAFLVAVPIAAGAGDAGTASTMFTLSNGVFVRVFPLAPASATLIAVGLVLRRSGVLGPRTATAALGLGIGFELAGIAAIFSTAGLVAAVALSVGQGLWVLAAGIGLIRSRPSRTARAA